MYDILKGLRIIEVSSFIASPSAGLYLSQLGAEVIRVDAIGGGPDYRRWPMNDSGDSFYWEGLNKGKQSLTVNIGSEEGKQIILDLAAAPGDKAGILLTNFPLKGFLSYQNLKQQRDDIIVVRVMGQSNGGPALDYTVNCSLGYPMMTGPASLDQEPVNHVLPAWDLLAGAYGAFSLLAAERHRTQTGEGGEYKIPLTDIGITAAANMGQIAEVLYQGHNRPRYGNELFGAFGRDFKTNDGERLMIMAITARQWKGLVKVLNIADQISSIETQRNVSLLENEGVRFEHRDALYPLVENCVATWQASELKQALDKVGGCWGSYQTMQDAAQDETLVTQNPVYTDLLNPSGFSYPTPGSALSISERARQEPKIAPKLGQNSRKVLASVLELSQQRIDEYIEQGIIGED